MPGEYMDKARAELRADLDWIAGRIADVVDSFHVEMLMSENDSRDADFCDALRAAISTAIDEEANDLAEKLWMDDVEESHRAAAEYAADQD